MRSFLRKASLGLAAVALIFYCSCERHHADELPAEQHAKGPAEDSAAHAHASPSPVHSTPANFFPEKKKP